VVWDIGAIEVSSKIVNVGRWFSAISAGVWRGGGRGLERGEARRGEGAGEGASRKERVTKGIKRNAGGENSLGGGELSGRRRCCCAERSHQGEGAQGRRGVVRIEAPLRGRV